MSIVETWARNSFEVEAARVTDSNLDQVADWCGGRVIRENGGRKRWIEVSFTEGDRTWEGKALVGDWIVIAFGRMTGFSDSDFRRLFRHKQSRTNDIGHLLNEHFGPAPSADPEMFVRLAEKIAKLYQGEN